MKIQLMVEIIIWEGRKEVQSALWIPSHGLEGEWFHFYFHNTAKGGKKEKKSYIHIFL